MTEPIASTPPPSASLIAKASLLTGRAIDRPFEVPGQMTESAYNAGGVAHGLVGRLSGAVLDGVSALQPRGFIEKLIGKSSERLDATLAHNQTRAETSKNIFWDPVSTGAHQIGQAFSNPFSLFYAKRAGFEIPTEPEQLRDMLANQITDPDPHVRFPTPPPPAEPEPAPAPNPGDPGAPAPTPNPEDPGAPAPTPNPEDPGTPAPTPNPEDPGAPAPTPNPEDPGTPAPTPNPEDPGAPAPTPNPEDPGAPAPTPNPEDPGAPAPTPNPEDPGAPAPTPNPEDPGAPAPKPDGETSTLPQSAPADDAAGTAPTGDDAAPAETPESPEDVKTTGAGASAAPKVSPGDEVKSQTLGLQPHPTDPIEQAPVEGAPSTGPIIPTDDAAKAMSAAIDSMDAPQRPTTSPVTEDAAPIASSPSAAAASLDAEAGARAVAPPVVDEPIATTAPAPRNVPAPTAPPMRTR